MNLLNNVEQNTDTIPFDFSSFIKQETVPFENNNDEVPTHSFIKSEIDRKIMDLNENVKNVLSNSIDTLLKQMFFEIGLKNEDIKLILLKLGENDLLLTLIIGLLKIKEKCGCIDDYTLEVPNDPEEGDDDGIFLTVYSNFSVERTMSIVDEIDNEWHLHQSEQFRNLFNYDISYK